MTSHGQRVTRVVKLPRLFTTIMAGILESLYYCAGKTLIPAGHVGGGTLLPKCGGSLAEKDGNSKMNGWGPFFGNDSQGYIAYGTGQYDGQGSGHNFTADVWHPSHGYVNNCDGARSHWSCDYRQHDISHIWSCKCLVAGAAVSLGLPLGDKFGVAFFSVLYINRRVSSSQEASLNGHNYGRLNSEKYIAQVLEQLAKF